jgi:hypothetical protein
MYERLLVAVDRSEITGRVLGAVRELALLSAPRYGRRTCARARPCPGQA